MGQDDFSRKLINVCIIALPLVFSVSPQIVLPFLCLISLLSSSLCISKLELIEKGRILEASCALVLIFLFILFQVTPLSPTWLQIISPETWQAYNETVWVLRPGTWMPISINVKETIWAGLFVASLGSLCLVLSQIVQTSRNLQNFAHTLAISIASWSLVSVACSLLLVTWPAGRIALHGWIPSLHTQCLFWAVVMLPFLLAGYAASRPRVKKRPLIEQLKIYIKAPVDTLHIMQLAAIVLVLFSLLVSLSPLYATASLLGWLLLSLFRQALTHRRNPTKVFFLATFAAMAYGGLVSLGGTLNIYAWDLNPGATFPPGLSSRWPITWFGCGLGAQADILKHVLISTEVIEGLGNMSSLLTLWLGLGSVGSIFILLTCISLISYGLRYRSSQSGRITRSMYAGGFSSLIVALSLAGIESGISWQPIIASVFIVVSIAAGASASHHWDFEYNTADAVRGRWLVQFIALSMLLVFFVGSIYMGGLYWAHFQYDHIEDKAQSEHGFHTERAFVETATEIARWAPFDASLKMKLAHTFLALGKISEANEMINEALSLRPLDPDALAAAVVSSAELGQEQLSLDLLQSKAIRRHKGGGLLEGLAARALKSPKSIVTEGFLTLALEIDPLNSSRYLNLMLLSDYTLNDLRNFLPFRSEAIMAYGDILLSAGEKDSAEMAYIEAVSLNSKENSNVLTFIHVAKYFATSGSLSKAQIVVQAGLEMFPDDHRLLHLAEQLSLQKTTSRNVK